MSVTDHVTAVPTRDADTLADRRAAVTRDAIRAAVANLLEHEHPATISVPDVARRSGISVRTIYRYFPTKQALIDDVADSAFRRLTELGEPSGGLYRDPERWLPTLWAEFARDISGIRAQHASPAGAELRANRLRKNRDAVVARLAHDHAGASEQELARLADVIIAVTSSRMFLELHDRMGHDVDDATELSMWIVRAVRAYFESAGLE